MKRISKILIYLLLTLFYIYETDAQYIDNKLILTDQFTNKDTLLWSWSKHQSIVPNQKFNSIIKSTSYGEWEASFHRKDYSLHHNKFLILHFKVDNDMSRAHFFIENGVNGTSNYRRFGVIAKNGKLIAEYNIYGTNKWVEEELLDTLNNNQWYILKIGIDDKHGFRIYVKSDSQSDKQSFYIFNKVNTIKGLHWRFYHHLYKGTAFIANYSEWEGNIKEPIFYNVEQLPFDRPQKYINKNIDSKSDYINTIFSANGKEFYFCGGIHCMKFENGRWNSEIDLKIPGVDVILSPDQNRLFFCSKELKTPDDLSDCKYQLWYCERENDSWSDPVYLTAPINYKDCNQIYPSFDNSGNLYFKSDRPGGFGGFDLYMSKFIDGKYCIPENLGPIINSEYDEGDAFISQDGSYIIFAAEGREENFGSGDLFISFKNNNGTWTEPENLGQEFNSKDYEYCPAISPDENYFFYKNYDSNVIFWCNTRFITEMRKLIKEY